MRILACLLFLTPVWLSAQDLKPYLQTPTENSIWVTWKTGADSESIVEYGLSADDLDQTASGQAEALASDYFWHQTKLENLSPNTAYYYRVLSGNESSEVRRFRTQPPKGTNSGHYRFLIIGDHQRHNDPLNDLRYQKLVDAARLKVETLYGAPFEDHLNLVLNAGDQVNTGVLTQYEHLHVNQSQGLCQNVPFMTVVGNHEYGSDPNLDLYFGHFVYDENSFHFQNISGPEGDSYYAFQAANVLFVMINSNVNNQNQTDWLTSIIEAADTDDEIDWVFSDCHHPLFAEVLPGDVSPYMKNTALPILESSEKMAMYISGHSHIYSRGAIHDHPIFHTVNGGASWDEHWGQYNADQDVEEVQKTFERQIFQIVDLNLDARLMQVQTYSIGTTLGGGFDEDRLIDEYFLKLDAPAPAQPSIENLPMEIDLPHVFMSSEYEGEEAFNSTEFQFAGADADFDLPILRVKRDFENLYQSTGAPLYEPIDQNMGMNIFNLMIDADQLPKGTNYVRVRHRDQSMHWSEWSNPVEFDALNGYEKIPIAYFPFNGNVDDESNNGKDFSGGALVNGQYLEDMERGPVIEFDDDGLLTIQSGANPGDGLPTQRMTVAAWVKVENADEWGGFVGQIQDTGSDESGWVLGTRFQKFSMALASVGNGQLTYLQAPEDFELDTWYHLVSTYDGGVLKLFINGELVATSTAQSGDIEYPDEGFFVIGSYRDDNENWGHDGALDEVTIWNVALTDQEVSEYYDSFFPTNISEVENDELQVQVLPNPSSGIFKIDIQNSKHARLTFTLSDRSGKEVFRDKGLVQSEPIEMDFSHLPKGTYFLSVGNHHESTVVKLVLE